MANGSRAALLPGVHSSPTSPDAHFSHLVEIMGAVVSKREPDVPGAEAPCILALTIPARLRHLSQKPSRFPGPPPLQRGAHSALSRNHLVLGQGRLDGLRIRESLERMKRVAFSVRVSTADGQSTEN